jgi:DNA-binding IclR family transcriptional regulator
MFHAVEPKTSPTQSPPEVRALSRGLRLLEILTDTPDGLSLTELTQEAQLSKSSTHRLLHTLKSNGYVLQNPTNSHYLPSLKLLELGSKLLQNNDLHDVARVVLKDLVAITGETVHLVLLDQNSAVYVEKVESPNSIRMYSKIGMRVPLHCTGVGKAILAYLADDKLDAFFRNSHLTRFSERTITNPEILKAQLEEIRANGYAIDDGEHEEQILCLAVPLFARNHQVVGAVSITAVSFRVNMEKLISWWPDLRRVAELLNNDLTGYFERYI